ncbi:flotillin family protein [Pseudarthrobacter sp. AL07]|uniref:flotillin family protein n=1 Tax=unclassified Pseudarthrobacter TaxID=2647000 RepID=UPI00249C678A|nr:MULTISPECIES: flotillin family protein [unclassified Pseudarthrobacter]MDI3193554.1 flotillin family protein [Pseudarthrobacter sp. AL20]MDI3207623.1 flotillin family protein [Pseudarthrobacter sp. AL07]
MVIYKIGDTPPFSANAARRFLGQQPKMECQVYNVFEGHLRSIFGSMTMAEIILERDKLGSQVRSASGVEMEKLGLVVGSCRSRTCRTPRGTSRTSPGPTSPRSNWRPGSRRPRGTVRPPGRRPRRPR